MASSAPLRANEPSPPQSDTAHASSDLPTLPISRQESSRPANPSLSSLGLSRALPATVRISTSSAIKPSVKRKPLPPTASPFTTRLSLSPEPLPDPQFHRSYEIDSPTLYENPLTPLSSAKETYGTFETDDGKQKNLRTSDETTTLTSSTPPGAPIRQRESKGTLNLTIPTTPETPSSATTTESVTPSDNNTNNVALRRNSVSTSISSVAPWSGNNTSGGKPQTDMSMFSNRPTPPHLALPSGHSAVGNFSSASTNNLSATNKPLTPPPKSPNASKLGSFFGWGGNSPNSSTASFSNPASPNVSPQKKSQTKKAINAARAVLPGIDTHRANASIHDYFGDAYLSKPPPTPAATAQVEEMEAELKTISSELATSIRREMELEDLVERLQAEAVNPQGQGRRTSDYFSDSGTSSVRYAGETDSKADELDRLQRKTEREKTQIRLELNEKVEDERSRRKQLESQIRTLEEKVSRVGPVSMNSTDTNGRLRELESTCEDLRRRLGEERRVKENFEDLLSALKGELQNSHNDRDNLRDEIVPQLRSRVEGLEAQASEHEKLTYENTKMQQEMQSLRDENATLANARRMQMEMQQQMNRFTSVVEETPPITPHSGSLSRSNSVAPRAVRAGSLTKSSSVKITESREALAERVKDIEMQRDALHSALKSLLERQEHQNRENDKKIRHLEMERDRIISDSPRRQGYDRDVANLREEINTLRRRADEAIEQKWQCEKGLSGLKMDLDRSEQEISSLRSLLREKDILIPPGLQNPDGDRVRNNSITSASLERAYRDLQNNYTGALERIKKLEASSSGDAETVKAMKELEQSLSAAIHERDFARQEVDQFRQAVESLHGSERGHISSEVALADDLRTSAKRVEELATQVRQQLASNATLRQRLSETIERGERDQKTNASRIVHMQSKLRSLEDAVVVAQQASEENVTKHEEEIRSLKESHNAQLRRVKEGSRSPRSFAAKTPLTPLFASGTSPRIDFTSTGKGMSIEEQTQTDFLKRRVIELEKALEEADAEMEEVVGKMNVSQIEVMELQNEREEAVQKTRKLQALIEGEKRNVSFRA